MSLCSTYKQPAFGPQPGWGTGQGQVKADGAAGQWRPEFLQGVPAPSLPYFYARLHLILILTVGLLNK